MDRDVWYEVHEEIARAEESGEQSRDIEVSRAEMEEFLQDPRWIRPPEPRDEITISFFTGAPVRIVVRD